MTDTNPAKFKKLVTLLKELFQLDQPDLDFGIYRIMHAKAGEVTQFLERDLLPQVKDAFSQYQSADGAELKRKLDQMVAQLTEAGVDPDTSPKVRELREQMKGAIDIGTLENEVYDHLYSFFRRYYSEGDFLAKRVYKPGVYAIPYEGEEVTLHWANKDQYYIKTSEYLRDYAFRLRPEAEEGHDPMRVHFRLVDAAEGEHGNVKASEGKDRVLVLAKDEFIGLSNGELDIRFEYRPATLEDWPLADRAGKKKPPAQKELTAVAVERILAGGDDFQRWLTELKRPHVKADGEQADYTRLEAHLRRYTARNTFDYFIHKDLGGFLRRELDFYIKNEVIHLDDVENEASPKVEQYLSKIKVIRRIAGKVIEFLAQLEDFQRKLWLKKKFVVGSDWLVAISQVSDDLLSAICANEEQLNEWKTLHSLHELPEDPARATYCEPLTPEYLRAHPSLLIDTSHFDDAFKARILELSDSLDEKTTGVLFHGDNFQSLSLMRSKYAGKINCVYIDPPYNTGTDEFVYKDAYQHSSWLSMMEGRLALAEHLLGSDGVLTCSLNDDETFRSGVMIESVFPRFRRLGEFVWRTRNTDNRVISRLSVDHEYVHVFARAGGKIEGRVIDRSSYKNPDNDSRGPYTTDPLTGKANAAARPNLHYTIVNTETGDRYLPHPDFGWITDEDGFAALLRDGRVYWPKNPQSGNPRKKRFLSEAAERAPVSSLEISIKQGEGNRDLARLFGEKLLNFPKPVSVLKTVVDTCCPDNGLVLDFFAGSGTTGEAVLRLNQETESKRIVLLAEMSGYFDTLLIPRLKKSAFSPEWSDGKPSRISTKDEAARSFTMIKVIRLESYEDTLNNLELSRSKQQQAAIDFGAHHSVASGMREQYLLRYQLHAESRGSASLLNVPAFSEPTAYKLKVKTPGSDENREVNVDLLETFNWLLGLTVQQITAPRLFGAEFERDKEGRLQLKGRLRQSTDGPFWFRTVTGTTPEGRKTLVIWRKLTGEPEQENLVLEEGFKSKQAYSVRDTEFDLIYVNGDNTLENLRVDPETWKVRLIEEDFHRLMFEGTEA